MEIKRVTKLNTKDRRFHKNNGVSFYNKSGLEMFTMTRSCLKCGSNFDAIGTVEGVRFVRTCDRCKLLGKQEIYQIKKSGYFKD